MREFTERQPERRRSWWSNQIHQTREKDRRLADRLATEARRARLAQFQAAQRVFESARERRD